MNMREVERTAGGSTGSASDPAASIPALELVGRRPVSQQHVDETTPMGATVLPDGVTFRVWAPAAQRVYVVTDEIVAASAPGWSPADRDALVQQADGTWTGFLPAAGDGTRYRYWVVGEGGAGFKRDPYARELSLDPPFPNCDCIVRDPAGYPWHDQGYRPPEFSELVIYQFHFGAFYAREADGTDARLHRPGKFLDLLERIPYLRELGVNAIQPLPIQEFPSQFSKGYNGTDYFSPEMDYQVNDEGELQRYLTLANDLLGEHGKPPLELDHLRPGINELKVVIDLCHLNGIAVIFDVVYNHAGGGFDDQSIWFMDRRSTSDPIDHANSLYFTPQGWAGGLVFDYAKPAVRQFLMDNARFLLQEYHADGLRYDEVTVMDRFGGWFFCQELAGGTRADKPSAIQVAEYWNDPGWRWIAVTDPPVGMGFDAVLGDGLRDALRDALSAAARGADAHVDLDRVSRALQGANGIDELWRQVQCIENHDIVYADRPPHEWKPRVARLADGSDPRSWYARSRVRVATGLLLTAPGIPMLFMGQEFLEHRNWTDNRDRAEGALGGWDELEREALLQDHLAFTRDLVGLRSRHPALRGERIDVFHAWSPTRVLAFHRWIDGAGLDVVVVASFNEQTYWGYELGFPRSGVWREVFNSDHYDNRPNPWVAGNGGRVVADGPPRHGLPCSSSIVIPANGLVVFVGEG